MPRGNACQNTRIMLSIGCGYVRRVVRRNAEGRAYVTHLGNRVYLDTVRGKYRYVN